MVSRIISGIKRRLSDPFWKNVATLTSGSVIAQALPVLVFPILTRVYSKEAIGFYFVFVGIGLITQIIASLQYELAILLPKDKKDSNTIFELSLIIVLVNTLIMQGLILLLDDWLYSLIKQEGFAQFIHLIPLSTFLLGMFRVLNNYMNLERKYKHIAYSKIAKSVTLGIIQVGMGLLGFLTSGMVIGLLAGQAVSVIYLVIQLIYRTEFKFQWDWTSMIRLAKVYKDMPIFNTAISFLSNLSNQLPVFFLSRYFGAAASGDYGLANRVVSTPMELVGSSVGQVFFQESAHLVKTKGDLHQLVKDTYKRLFKIAIIPFLLLLISAPWLFSWFFSDEYITSGYLTQILIPWLFLNFLNSPVSYLFDVLNKQRFMTIFHTVYFLSRIAGLLAGFYIFQNVFIAVAIFSTIGILFNGYTIYYYLKISKSTDFQIYK
ncbi:MAG TPA: hypothetical protein DCQ26_10225 [Marinilabiliales bacterium]|nr:MAG: hypothetical protein A2W95_13920 [Bacteroidetes bacterium GWA2_40_14]OFX63580.1 MAG: hypothetical protein A2W84_08600 [Bacteroidetes bacterium GWC2_40_13]OFX73274.1 MAG: hypothetical protein A2W96_07380 [Bacteroidetes bacterium GWD2_40_43]OFX92129.1 MAG: hypothetical protein A2W97_08670 [Bacteroidetes bacterium GWE2_40_63]OFY24301.1 MAG: hypothetical protein A2W88_07540 [Bacteroidetes bacterium GWF2_40_13]OFZ28918.1 MAG: hypothetical protein A2437_02630 [Bacteroidetes bacterium RIFOXYC